MNVTCYKFNPESTHFKSENICLNPVEFLEKQFTDRFNFGNDHLTTTGHFKMYGWDYDFKPFLKRYIVKQYGNWREYYSLNKTTLRKVIGGRIQEIVEINKIKNDKITTL